MSTADPNIDRVIDAPSDNFVYRILPRWLWPHAQLARWDRPIGWQLLMWPCFWSSALAANALAAEGRLNLALFAFHLFLFFVGSVAMRGAGCTYNDLVDHDIDNMVARTRSRPLPSGRISRRNAKIFMVVQSLVGLAVLLCFNGFSIVLGILSLAIVAIYPFAKRFTWWPQAFLGLAFNWGALLAWAAVMGLSGPLGIRGVWEEERAVLGMALGSVPAWSGEGPPVVAQPVSQSRPARQAMCRIFIGIRSSIGAGRPAPPQRRFQAPAHRGPGRPGPPWVA